MQEFLLKLGSRSGKLYGLYAVVFLTGAAILVVEVSATRILSPYFGNTIYTFSSVISVILGALSLGYWRGGILADKTPGAHEFFKIIYKGGIALSLMFVLIVIALPISDIVGSLVTGPIIWSLILFFVPSYQLGMLSPFAVKLAQETANERGLGQLTGSIFFWSTTGSIAGSLLTGFVLLPHLNITTIISATAIFVLILGGAGMLATKPGSLKDHTAMLIFIGTLIVGTLWGANAYRPDNIVFMTSGVYEQMIVLDGVHEGKSARFFLQDKSMSGGMYLDSNEHPFSYTKYYALHHLLKPDISSALFIGAGIYTMPRSLHAERPNVLIDVVDIEPKVHDIAVRYFRLPDTPNIRTHVADGRKFLKDSKISYDIISSDVYYSLFSIPAHFTTKEFFQLAHDRLNDGGIFYANIIGDVSLESPSLLYSELRTMKEVFANVYVFAVDSPNSNGLQNFIVVGTKENNPINFTDDRITNSPSELIRSLPEKLLTIDGIDLSKYALMTDNYSPVEYLVARLLKIQDTSRDGSSSKFDDLRLGEEAMLRIKEIVALGPRAVGSPVNAKLRTMIENEFHKLGIEVSHDRWNHVKKDGTTIELGNVIGRIHPELERRVIIGTHHDSIVKAYRDKKFPDAPMPGANNGASGVAVLLEVAEALAARTANDIPFGIDVVFFDGEEGENALGAGDPTMTPLGSAHFAKKISEFYPSRMPEEAIIIDMVCDKNLRFPQEAFSLQAAPEAVARFWAVGQRIAPEVFVNKKSVPIGDDQVALIYAGIPSFLVIDFNYEPYWNTRMDTPDKCSAESLETISRTITTYLSERK